MSTSEILLLIILLLLILNVILLLFRKPAHGDQILSELSVMGSDLKGIASLVQQEASTNREEFSKNSKSDREELNESLKANREESSKGLNAFNDQVSNRLDGFNDTQRLKFNDFSDKQDKLKAEIESKLDKIRETVETKLEAIEKQNAAKLDEMRATVDEKLQTTLEKRLGESFKLVSERLDTVHKGLGEMQTLATGVGDLKRVLTNVKARGTWAEVQLGSILEQVLTARQYEKNVAVKPDSGERVEYAVRLPGQRDDPTGQCWLPIDSKFPQEDYLRIQEAADAGDADRLQTAVEALARTIRNSAKDICAKYVCPPHTTDFAIMFLSTEGLHAEVLRQPALVDTLQQQYRIIVAGPTTLLAILSSLRMGFQTLAIEQRASEVWRILGAIKTEFSKFGDVLAKVKRQIDTASRTIDETGVRSRAMEKHLRSVEQMPEIEASQVLSLAVEKSLDGNWASPDEDISSISEGLPEDHLPED